MKLFIKKYIGVLLLSLVLYSIFFTIKEKECNYFNYSLIVSLIYSLLIRLFDDFLDYEQDKINNRNVFKKPVLSILLVILFILQVVIIIISEMYLFLIVLSLLILNLYNKYKIIRYSKSLYVPVICLSLCFHSFGFNLISFILITVLFIGDLILIHRKR